MNFINKCQVQSGQDRTLCVHGRWGDTPARIHWVPWGGRPWEGSLWEKVIFEKREQPAGGLWGGGDREEKHVAYLCYEGWGRGRGGRCWAFRALRSLIRTSSTTPVPICGRCLTLYSLISIHPPSSKNLPQGHNCSVPCQAL